MLYCINNQRKKFKMEIIAFMSIFYYSDTYKYINIIEMGHICASPAKSIDALRMNLTIYKQLFQKWCLCTKLT